MRLIFRNHRALRAGGTEESQKSELKVWLQYCARASLSMLLGPCLYPQCLTDAKIPLAES